MKDFKTLNEQIVNMNIFAKKKASATLWYSPLFFEIIKFKLWCIFTGSRNSIERVLTGIKRMVIFVNRTWITI